MKSDDLRLIELTLAGDRDAFGELVLRYQDRLFGTLVHMLGSVHDARDIGQEAFLSAYEKLGTFRKEASFYSWLFRIAYNAAVSSRRKKGRNLPSIDQYRENTGDEPTDDNPTTAPSHRLSTLQIQKDVHEALDQLGQDYRDAIIMKEMEGLKYEEIAEIQGCPIGTVRSRIFRARRELKEILSRTADIEQN